MVIYGVFYNNDYDCTELIEVFIEEKDAETYLESNFENNKYAYVMDIEVF